MIMENEVQKKRILSGIQPSGDLTLGSYLGASRNCLLYTSTDDGAAAPVAGQLQ